LWPGSAPGPLGELYSTPRPPAALLHLGEEEGQRWERKGEGKWRGHDEKRMGGEGSCSSKNSFKITVIMCSCHHCHLLAHAHCAILVPCRAGHRDVAGVKPVP